MTGSMKWTGDFDLERTYEIGDIVFYSDDQTNYVCVYDGVAGIPPHLVGSGFQPFSKVDITFIDGGSF